MFTALETNEMITARRLLTGSFNFWCIYAFSESSNNLGYTAGAEALTAVARFVRKLKQERDDLIYLLDRAFHPFVHIHTPCSNYPQITSRHG